MIRSISSKMFRFHTNEHKDMEFFYTKKEEEITKIAAFFIDSYYCSDPKAAVCRY